MTPCTHFLQMLELVHADCEQLLSSVHNTAQLADHISSKVRRLDLVQTRVQDTLGKINLILDRTNCINGVQAAMDSEVKREQQTPLCVCVGGGGACVCVCVCMCVC